MAPDRLPTLPTGTAPEALKVRLEGDATYAELTGARRTECARWVKRAGVFVLSLAAWMAADGIKNRASAATHAPQKPAAGPVVAGDSGPDPIPDGATDITDETRQDVTDSLRQEGKIPERPDYGSFFHHSAAMNFSAMDPNEFSVRMQAIHAYETAQTRTAAGRARHTEGTSYRDARRRA